MKGYHKLLEFQRQVEKINAQKRKWVLNDFQIESLSDYLIRNKNKRIVAKQVKLEIEENFPEIRNISLSTVTRLLKQRFLFSYKELSKQSISYAKQSNLMKFVEVCSSLSI